MMNSLTSLSNALPLLLKGVAATVQISLVSIAVGLLGGIGIGILNCQKMQVPFLKSVLSSFVWLIRGTPLFVQVLIIYYALPELIGITFSPFTAGVIALGINSAAYISVIVRAGIDAVPNGQWEAAFVLGLSKWQTLKGIVLAQMFRTSLPGLTNELTALIKETSILMVIGVSELTKVSKEIVARELDPMTIYLAAALLYLIMTSAVSLMTHKMQGRAES
jgi:arginine/lysine/histidine transport system permease protein